MERRIVANSSIKVVGQAGPGRGGASGVRVPAAVAAHPRDPGQAGHDVRLAAGDPGAAGRRVPVPGVGDAAVGVGGRGAAARTGRPRATRSPGSAPRPRTTTPPSEAHRSRAVLAPAPRVRRTRRRCGRATPRGMPGAPPGRSTMAAPMRFLHTADWHVGKTLKGRSRLDEQEQVLREIVGIARAHEVDAVLVAGDLYDTRGADRPTPRSSSTARCSGWRSDGVEVIAIAGNHDHAATIDAYRGVREGRRDHAGRHGAHGRATAASSSSPPGRPASARRSPCCRSCRTRYAVRAAELVARHPGRAHQRLRPAAARHPGQAHRGLPGRRGEPRDGPPHRAGRADGRRRAGRAVDLRVRGARRRSSRSRRTTSRSATCTGGRRMAALVPGALQRRAAGRRLRRAGEHAGRLRRRGRTRHARRASPTSRSQAGRRLRTVRGTVAELSVLGEMVGDDFLRVWVREPARAGLREEVTALLPNALEVRIDPEFAAPVAATPAVAGAGPHPGRAVRRVPRHAAGWPIRGSRSCSARCTSGSPADAPRAAGDGRVRVLPRAHHRRLRRARSTSPWSGPPARASPR